MKLFDTSEWKPYNPTYTKPCVVGLQEDIDLSTDMEDALSDIKSIIKQLPKIGSVVKGVVIDEVSIATEFDPEEQINNWTITLQGKESNEMFRKRMQVLYEETKKRLEILEQYKSIEKT